ncbi:MAG: hypothetical protein MUC50_15205 [Myxococcota bacterium]|jgi:hypothetical protein|nr:hypothetical protein [Myxococcota bacterium]
MTQRCQWVTHKGKTILVQDYRGLSGASFMAAVRENEAFSLAQEVKSGIRVLVDVTDTYVDRETLKMYKESAKQFRDFFDKRAAVGVTGVHRLFLEVICRFAAVSATPFDTRDQALDWLASDDN